MAVFDLDALTGHHESYDVCTLEGRRLVIGAISDELRARAAMMAATDTRGWKALLSDWLESSNSWVVAISDQQLAIVIALFWRKICE